MAGRPAAVPSSRRRRSAPGRVRQPLPCPRSATLVPSGLSVTMARQSAETLGSVGTGLAEEVNVAAHGHAPCRARGDGARPGTGAASRQRAIGFPVVGAAIARQQPRHPIAWIVLHWFTTRCTFSSCLPDPGRLAVPTRPVVVRAAPTLPCASRVRLPSASAVCCDRPPAGSFLPPGQMAPRGARCRPGTGSPAAPRPDRGAATPGTPHRSAGRCG